MFAAELPTLPPDPQFPGQPKLNDGPDGQVLFMVGAAVLVLVPLICALAFSRRRKRKRMTHRPRNPTLAETGGLPPPRLPQ
jgi:hypothetical protein